MAVSKISRRKITFTIPYAAQRQLVLLAEKEGCSVPGYVRRLVLRSLERQVLPIYWQGPLDGPADCDAAAKTP